MWNRCSVQMPLWWVVVDYNLYLVMDGHTAGCILLEDFCHPVGESFIFQLGLLLAVLLLVEKEVFWDTNFKGCLEKVFIMTVQT